VIYTSIKKIRETDITIAEAYKLLKGLEEPNPLQSRVLDYARKVAKIDPSKAAELVDKLIEKFGLERDRAVQIVNTMPGSIEELRVFFVGLKGRLITTAQLKDILKLLDEYRVENVES